MPEPSDRTGCSARPRRKPRNKADPHNPWPELNRLPAAWTNLPCISRFDSRFLLPRLHKVARGTTLVRRTGGRNKRYVEMLGASHLADIWAVPATSSALDHRIDRKPKIRISACQVEVPSITTTAEWDGHLDRVAAKIRMYLEREHHESDDHVAFAVAVVQQAGRWTRSSDPLSLLTPIWMMIQAPART